MFNLINQFIPNIFIIFPTKRKQEEEHAVYFPNKKGAKN